MTDQSADNGSFPQAEIPTVGPMDDLIARLEAGGGGDCDERLARWLYENPGICGGLVNYDPMLWLERNGGWTTSLDAALALAERIRWRVRSMDSSIEGRFNWCLQSLDPHPGVDAETGAIMTGIDFRYGAGKTPALALCIAVLKAVSVGTKRSGVSSNTPTTGAR